MKPFALLTMLLLALTFTAVLAATLTRHLSPVEPPALAQGIAVIEYRGCDGGTAGVLCASIVLVDPTNGTTRYFDLDRNAAPMTDLSPALTHAVFTYNGAFFLLNTSDGELTAVSERITGRVYAFAWSADGGQLLYSTTVDDLVSDLWVMQLESGEIRLLLDDFSGFVIDLHWSPDSEWIAFTAVTPFTALANVYAVRADGTALTPITQSMSVNVVADWSGDSEYFALLNSDQQRQNILIASPVDGQSENVTTDTDGKAIPRWTLNDTSLLYGLYNAQFVGRFRLLDLSRRLTVDIIPSSPAIGYDVSPDGMQIVYVTLTADNTALCTIDLYTLSERCFDDVTPTIDTVPDWE